MSQPDEELVDEYHRMVTTLAEWIKATHGTWVVEDMAFTAAMAAVQHDVAVNSNLAAKGEVEDPEMWLLDFLGIPAAMLKLESRMLVAKGLMMLATVGVQTLAEMKEEERDAFNVDTTKVTHFTDTYLEEQVDRCKENGIDVPDWEAEVAQIRADVDYTIEKILDEGESE